MTERTSPGQRMREIGLFDLQTTLPGLLQEVILFLQKHGLDSPRSFEPRETTRGWRAFIELEWADFCRVLDQYPLDGDWVLTQDGEETLLQVSVELRAAVLTTTIPKRMLSARVRHGGLMLALPTHDETEQEPVRRGAGVTTHLKIG